MFGCDKKLALALLAFCLCAATARVCKEYELECFDSNSCINKTGVCDAKEDCWWGEDERNCKTCKSGALKCQTIDKCVLKSKWCDGFQNCADGTDENNCSFCKKGARLCGNGKECILAREWCDGYRQCYDGSDDANCSACVRGAVHCGDGLQCVSGREVCDGSSDCRDGSDEKYCRACEQQKADGKIQCINRTEPCTDRAVAIDQKRVKVTYCTNDTNKELFQTIHNTTQCRALMGPCPGRKDKACSNGGWICEGNNQNTNLSQCTDGNFIWAAAFCDSGLGLQCNDDETKTGFGFKCAGSARKGVCVLPQINLYDQEAQCADRSDICFVDGEFICFLCLDKRLVISQQQVCDGVADCYDLSDECLCGNKTVCDSILGDSKETCPQDEMHCSNSSDCTSIDRVLCEPKVKCAGDVNMKHCSGLKSDQDKAGEIPCRPNLYFGAFVMAKKCDGRPECVDMRDECSGCANRPAFCDMGCMYRRAKYAGGACQGIQHPTLSATCNETGICSMRHECMSAGFTSVDVSTVCDGIVDCDDRSDEDQGLCSGKRFYCRNGKPLSVDIAFVEDGIPQCSDGSDECPPISKRNTIFSNQKEMIANPIFRAIFWIMGLTAAIGNLTILIITAKEFLNKTNAENFTKSTYIFLLSLVPADFLMGLYLIAISIKGHQFSGHYCSFDAFWRTSFNCSVLGMMCIIATMASSGTMAVMTAFRLLTIYKPFIIRTLELKWIYLSCFSVWLFAILFAVMPVIDYSSGYFVAQAWFVSRFFDTDQVPKQKMVTLAYNIRPTNASLSWHDVTEIIGQTFPNQPIKGVVGYYGETSVCMPRLFASVNDSSWQYSVCLITINFLLFIFMLVSYVLIYIRSNRMSKAKNRQPNTKMQKRISRLLITDFCCWIPMCVLGYVALSGVPLSKDVYVVSAGILLPINSAMNPILYSALIDRCFAGYHKVKTSVRSSFSSTKVTSM